MGSDTKKRQLPQTSTKYVNNKSLVRTSIVFGGLLGAIFGSLLGAAFGAITTTWNGILIGLGTGLGLGILTGTLTAALTARIAGTTGGIGVGYFTGMIFGGVFGILLGVLIPPSLWTIAATAGWPVLRGLTISRFEIVMHVGFLFSVLAAIIGVWVSGKNLVPRNLKKQQQDQIDQYDLVEIIRVPEQQVRIIQVGDIGVVVEKYDEENFEIECLRPDGTYDWLETLNIQHIRLKYKIPDNR